MKGRSRRTRERSGQQRSKATPGLVSVGDPTEFDPLVHQRVRLGILSVLAVNEGLTFNDLKDILKTTDGNLSVHARKLEEAGYVDCTKSFVERVPKTEYRLTSDGREALERYLEQMEKLIEITRAS